MTKLFFCFDTEDFTSNHAADAIYREAEILRSHGIRGNFNLVGLICDQFQNWNRTDVIEALKAHELAIHSYGHSLHPTINEYTDIANYETAAAELQRQEEICVEKIHRVFGDVKMNGACPPGSSKSYVALYTYADMGVSVYADGFMRSSDDHGVFICNLFQLDYAYCMEGSFFTDTEEDLRRLVDWFAEKKYAVLYTHPHRALFKEHWDKYNYNKCNMYPWGQWKEPPRYTEEETEVFYANMNRFVELVQADPRFEISSYDELAKELQALPPRVIHQEDLPMIREALRQSFTWLQAPVSLSLSDITLACAQFLTGKEEHVCGPVYGFLETPYASEGGFDVTLEDMKTSAYQLLHGGFLPEAIWVGDKKIGPADWLFAALDLLCGSEKATVTPKAQLPSLDEYPTLRDFHLKGSWLHSDSFEDRYLSDRLRLQSWTIRRY